LCSIFDVLSSCYAGGNTLELIDSNLKPYPGLRDEMSDWVTKYTDIAEGKKTGKGYKNRIVYKMDEKENYFRLVLDFIAGMTDRYALRVFDELTKFA
jgi:dGTPase